MLQKGSEVSGQDRLLGFAQTQCVEEKKIQNPQKTDFLISAGSVIFKQQRRRWSI